jgi:hypothetical protein
VFSAWIGAVARFPVPKIYDHNETQRNKTKRMHASKKPSVACPPPAFTLIELLVERRGGKVKIGKGGKHPALLEPLF